MKNNRFLFLLLGTAVAAAGCSRQGLPTTDGGVRGRASLGDSRPSTEQTGSWTYHSPQHHFSLRLPSHRWKQIPRPRLVVDFWCPRTGQAPLLAGVTQVRKETREEFRAWIPRFETEMEREGPYLVRPRFQVGQTSAGNPYLFAQMCQSGIVSSQFTYVAAAVVWLADKGLTVTTLFETQVPLKSKTIQAAEYAELAGTARSICLSPQ